MTGPSPPRTIHVSAVVLRDASGRVLNVRKRGTNALMLPGGKPEPGETPEETAIREILEELAITLDPSRLTVVGRFRTTAANEPGFALVADVFEHPATPEALTATPKAEIEHLEWVDPGSPRSDLAPLNTEFVFPALRGAPVPGTADSAPHTL